MKNNISKIIIDKLKSGSKKIGDIKDKAVYKMNWAALLPVRLKIGDEKTKKAYEELFKK